MSRRLLKPLLIAALSTLVVAVVVARQRPASASDDSDWPMYSRDPTGSRFSPLADIHTGNVSQLTQAWSVQLTVPAGRRGGGGGAAPAPGAAGRGAGAGRGAAAADEGDAAGSNPQVTPIVVAGVMYLPARGNQVLALDADSGHEIWRYQMPPTVTTTARGVAYWPGEGSIGARILLTAGPRLLALDAQTGRPSQGFGRDGFVEIHGAVERRAGDLQARRHPRHLPGRGAARRAGRHPGVRRADRKEAVAVPERAAARAARSRDVARLRLARALGDQRLGVLHDPRRRARHPLHARVVAGGELLGRRSPRQQPVRQLHRCRRCRDREVSLALPDRAPRRVGLRHAVAAGARRHHAGRSTRARARVDRQDRLHVHPQSRHREADLRRRGASRARRARCPTNGIRRRSRFQ